MAYSWNYVFMSAVTLIFSTMPMAQRGTCVFKFHFMKCANKNI